MPFAGLLLIALLRIPPGHRPGFLVTSSSLHLLVGYFQTLLKHIVEAPDKLTSELSLLEDAERDQLLSQIDDFDDEDPDDQQQRELDALFED